MCLTLSFKKAKPLISVRVLGHEEGSHPLRRAGVEDEITKRGERDGKKPEWTLRIACGSAWIRARRAARVDAGTAFAVA